MAARRGEATGVYTVVIALLSVVGGQLIGTVLPALPAYAQIAYVGLGLAYAAARGAWLMLADHAPPASK